MALTVLALNNRRTRSYC